MCVDFEIMKNNRSCTYAIKICIEPCFSVQDNEK